MGSITLPLRLCRRPHLDLPSRHTPTIRYLSIKSPQHARGGIKRDDDPTAALEDMIRPGNIVRPQDSGTPLASRHPSSPADASNPGLSGYPSRDGRFTTSQQPQMPARPSGTTNSPPGQGGPSSTPSATSTSSSTSARPTSGSTPQPAKFNPFTTNSNSTSELLNLYETSQRTVTTRKHTPTTPISRRIPRTPDPQTTAHARSIEAQALRPWTPGFVYTPKDLSPVESLKTKNARTSRTPKPLNSRNRGWTDAFEEAGIKPMAEWKNFALMSQFVSETGRIKSARETGLKAVNQRRMAKAVRRAIGTGVILPSSYGVPELNDERVKQREGLLSKSALNGGLGRL